MMTNGTSVLESLIEPECGDFSADLAHYVLALDFSAKQHDRYGVLSEKAQDGNLSEEEEAELDEFLAANALLMVLQSKARRSLKQHNPAA